MTFELVFDIINQIKIWDEKKVFGNLQILAGSDSVDRDGNISDWFEESGELTIRFRIDSITCRVVCIRKDGFVEVFDEVEGKKVVRFSIS